MRLSTALALVLLIGAGTSVAQDAPAPTIDTILDADWKARGMERAPLASDSEFLRRVTLDLTGTIPSETEALDWSTPLKKHDRAKKIDDLLASPRYAEFMGATWIAVLYGYREGQFDTSRERLAGWLRKAFAENMLYDRMIAQLLTASGGNDANPLTDWVGRYYTQTGRPEEIAVKVSRTFLGIRLNCARCHDHPYDKWVQEDFYGLAAFFKATERQYVTNGRFVIVDKPERATARYSPPDLNRAVETKFLSGAKPQTANLREELALFLTSNRQFARAFANRLWYHLFGRGIVHPVDNFSKKNPASVPKLLEFLTDEAIRLKFDVKAMIRLIASSRAYQLSSSRVAADPDREAVFALAGVRPLTVDQTVASIMVALPIEAALGKVEAGRVRQVFQQYLVRNAIDEDFTNVFEYRESMQDVMTKMSIDMSRVKGKGWFAESPSIERVYLLTLSRRPTAAERRTCEQFLKRGGTSEELAITLINSHEFAFNH